MTIIDEKSIANLKEYIRDDLIYLPVKEGKTKIESDFDAFCYRHCEDIDNIINLVKQQENIIKELQRRINENDK